VKTAHEKTRAYLAAQPPTARKVLHQMRDTIRAVAPDAIEHFSYGIPGFKLGDAQFIWYAGFKQHASLFPMTANIRRKHAAALKGYEMATGTVRFPLDEPLPLALVKKLVKERATEVRSQKR
jgi:uncharacterized protein YdhG (YjbR/CyaY superfamily)